MTRCGDCFWFKRKCEWLLSRDPKSKHCDWSPSRFLSSDEMSKILPPKEVIERTRKALNAAARRGTK